MAEFSPVGEAVEARQQCELLQGHIIVSPSHLRSVLIINCQSKHFALSALTRKSPICCESDVLLSRPNLVLPL